MALITGDIAAQAGAASISFVVGLNFPPLALVELVAPDPLDLTPTLPYPVRDDIKSVDLIGADSPVTSGENRVAEYIDSRTETLRDLLNLAIRDMNLIPLFFVNKDGEATVDGAGDPDPSYMRGNLDMGGFTVILTTDGVNAQDLATRQQWEAVQFSGEDDVEQVLDTQIIRRDGTIQFGADFDMGSITKRRLLNLTAPTTAFNLDTKTNVDTQVTAFQNDYLPVTGSNPMTASLNFQESVSIRHKLINVGAPVANGDLMNKFTLDAQVVLTSPKGVPVGAVIAYGAFVSQIAGNFLACNGQEVSRSLYQNLFNTIGTVYGTPSSAGTFKLPDLRGRIPVGLDNLGGASANVITDPDADQLGKQFGVALQTLSIPQLAAHQHTYTDTISSSSNAGAETGSTDENATNTSDSDLLVMNSAGSGDGHPNIQPSMPFAYFIRF